MKHIFNKYSDIFRNPERYAKNRESMPLDSGTPLHICYNRNFKKAITSKWSLYSRTNSKITVQKLRIGLLVYLTSIVLPECFSKSVYLFLYHKIYITNI